MKRWRCCCKQSEGEFLASLRGETSHLKCILVAALEVLESRVFKVIQTVCRPGLTGCVCGACSAYVRGNGATAVV